MWNFVKLLKVNTTLYYAPARFVSAIGQYAVFLSKLHRGNQHSGGQPWPSIYELSQRQYSVDYVSIAGTRRVAVAAQCDGAGCEACIKHEISRLLACFAWQDNAEDAALAGNAIDLDCAGV